MLRVFCRCEQQSHLRPGRGLNDDLLRLLASRVGTNGHRGGGEETGEHDATVVRPRITGCSLDEALACSLAASARIASARMTRWGPRPSYDRPAVTYGCGVQYRRASFFGAIAVHPPDPLQRIVGWSSKRRSDLAVSTGPAMITCSGRESGACRTPTESPSSRGLGRGPFKAKTRVRIPLGTPAFAHVSREGCPAEALRAKAGYRCPLELRLGKPAPSGAAAEAGRSSSVRDPLGPNTSAVLSRRSLTHPWQTAAISARLGAGLQVRFKPDCASLVANSNVKT